MAQLQGEAKRKYVAAMFARIARSYDLMNDLMTLGMHRRWRREAARYASAGLEGPALDIATGTGDLALALGRQEELTHIVGLDLLPEMVALARRKVLRAGLAGRVDLAVGDALHLPFADNAFACVTSAFALRNMPVLREALAEATRVLKPGGRLLALEVTPMEGSGLLDLLLRFYIHRVVPLVGGIITSDREAYRYLPQSIDILPTASELMLMLSELGLRDVGYKRLGVGTVTLFWGTRARPGPTLDHRLLP